MHYFIHVEGRILRDLLWSPPLGGGGRSSSSSRATVTSTSIWFYTNTSCMWGDGTMHGRTRKRNLQAIHVSLCDISDISIYEYNAKSIMIPISETMLEQGWQMRVYSLGALDEAKAKIQRGFGDVWQGQSSGGSGPSREVWHIFLHTRFLSRAKSDVILEALEKEPDDLTYHNNKRLCLNWSRPNCLEYLETEGCNESWKK